MDETELNEKIFEKKEKLKKLYEGNGFWKRCIIYATICLFGISFLGITVIQNSKEYKWLGILLLIVPIILFILSLILWENREEKIKITEDELRNLETKKILQTEEKNNKGD